MLALWLRMRLARGALLACMFCVGTACLRAQTLPELGAEQEGLAEKPEAGQWSGAIGPGLVSRPRYQGADTSRVRFAPLVLIRYDNLFFGPLGLGWAAIHLEGFHAGPVIGYEGGRRESADPHLYGLGNIPGCITGGVFATYRFEPFEIGATVRQALSHRDNGLNGSVRLDYRLQIVPRQWELRVGPHLDFANAAYEQTRFGVSFIQSEQSGLPVFTPGGGLKDVGLRATLTYISADHLLVRGFVGISRLTGDSADSPIVLERTQRFIGAGIAYHF